MKLPAESRGVPGRQRRWRHAPRARAPAAVERGGPPVGSVALSFSPRPVPESLPACPTYAQRSPSRSQMYLKSLTLKGFKSFASVDDAAARAGHHLHRRPNGSGKSNVVDALAWVMGEQGAKSLRGGKMEDVIFAGTSGRPPLGRAEVVLTIDNTDGALPIEYAEVTISRTHVPQRRLGVRDQRHSVPAARRAGAPERLRHRPRDARHRRPGPARPDPARDARRTAAASSRRRPASSSTASARRRRSASSTPPRAT